LNIGLMEKVVNSTVRIETVLSSGGISTGTGFYMHFLQETDWAVPVIITNKHVVKDAQIGRIHVSLAEKSNHLKLVKHRRFEIQNFEKLCVMHPEPDVDLAAFPIAPLIREAESVGEKLFYAPISPEIIPLENERLEFSSMEEIVMVGYPNGIWDSVNNLPVIRKGITATHAGVKWNGKSEFLTDIASFPGSSGSPVLILNIGSYMDNLGNVYMGKNRVKLLGVHYAGAMHTAKGEIQLVTAPSSNIPIPLTQIPNNIGVAVSSEKILDIQEIIRKKVGK